jgi:dual specificity tyrosine-phosphorylation-regulated kinase 2/3/4
MIYFLGYRRYSLPDNKFNFDDEEGEMTIKNYDQIAYRYEVKSSLGKGSFGQVFKAFDHKNKEFIALKVIKNKPKYNTQAKV